VGNGVKGEIRLVLQGADLAVVPSSVVAVVVYAVCSASGLSTGIATALIMIQADKGLQCFQIYHPTVTGSPSRQYYLALTSPSVHRLKY
jgi:2-keto-3-deoxy-6-phosphogluconate aldolase